MVKKRGRVKSVKSMNVRKLINVDAGTLNIIRLNGENVVGWMGLHRNCLKTRELCAMVGILFNLCLDTVRFRNISRKLVLCLRVEDIRVAITKEE